MFYKVQIFTGDKKKEKKKKKEKMKVQMNRQGWEKKGSKIKG